MPAGLPSDSLANNLANPTGGPIDARNRTILFDPLSGPKGSPLDKGSPGTVSTGALSTGIGIGLNSIFSAPPATPQVAVYAAGFNYNQEPGTAPTYAVAPPPGVVATNVVNSNRMYIGGGRTIANGVAADKWTVPFVANPYTAGVALVAAGNGGSRDAGAGPAFTGFPLRLLAATGGVANGAAIAAGFINRTGVAMVNGQAAFGSDAAALAVAS
jgi:hypothetical protein